MRIIINNSITHYKGRNPSNFVSSNKKIVSSDKKIVSSDKKFVSSDKKFVLIQILKQNS